MESSIVTAREIYDLILKGHYDAAQALCREFLAKSPEDVTVNLLYAKSFELAANFPEAVRSYLALIAIMKNGGSGTDKTLTNSVRQSLSDLCAQIVLQLGANKDFRTIESIVACYDVVLSQLASDEPLASVDTLLKLAIVLLDSKEYGMFLVTAKTILRMADDGNDSQFILFREMAGRGFVSEELSRLGTQKALRTLRVNGGNLLALWVVLNYAYHKHKYGLIERIMRRVRSKVSPVHYKSMSQYYMLRTSKRFFSDCVVDQEYTVEYTAFVQAVAKRDLVILVSCDEIYYRRAAAGFVSELLSSGDDVTVHLNVVDPTPETMDELLSFSNSRDTFGYSTFQSRSILKAGRTGGNNFESVKTLYACSRFFVLPKIIRQYERKVLILDSDQHVVGPLPEFLNRFADKFTHDFAITHGANVGPGIDYFADMVAVSNSITGFIYAHLVSKYLSYFFRQDFHFWTLDQVTLLAVHIYLKSIGHDPSVYFLDTDDLQTADFISHYGGAHIRHELPNVRLA